MRVYAFAGTCAAFANYEAVGIGPERKKAVIDPCRQSGKINSHVF